jgi:transcriptional regulator with GAF, ATPase, and Fis domain
MKAELIVVSGSCLGEHYSLDGSDFRIGRAIGAHLRIDELGVATEHCLLRAQDGRYYVTDRHTGGGTYVNGMRIAQHPLEGGDQIGVGETTLVYRENGAAPADLQQTTLLRACALLFMFRGLATAESDSLRATLESQILRLIADLVPCAGGAVRLRDVPMPARPEGMVSVEMPLVVRSRAAGALAAWFAPEQASRLPEHRETLEAVAAIAIAALEAVRQVERLEGENRLLREQLDSPGSGIVGESIAIHKLLGMIGRVAPQDTSVLILGESGTGKELVAHAVHRLSPRVGKPFVAINCAALTETLLESELFGHEKGAFTGAVVQKKGKLEAADGGTVFLDEIGELALSLQAKLLRVLQQREFERVGGTRTMKLDIRLIAATNRDLAVEARRGTFREDLYHRLNVVALRVPPLRDRPQDILPLAGYFLDRAAARCRRRVAGFSGEAQQCLTAYSWPGNVRELENAVEHAVVLGESDQILPEDLPETVFDTPKSEGQESEGLHSSVVETKRELILAAWRQSGGDHDRAAERLNLHPNSLRRLIRTLGLRPQLQDQR